MGTAVCTRRQKGFLQTGFFLLALASGVFWHDHLQQKVKAAEDTASKHRQQREALSAQLQVVYEHRSRLERSLQKERSEHKKTKEDFLVYKLEAQEALNKEKQDSMNRYGALSSQQKILKNQHEEVKKQLLDLQLLHNGLKLEHRKALETHNQKYSQWQREKETEVAGLQDTVYKLREESKLLRKAHQDVHSQLLNAQVQMEEFRKLKETLQRMPSFKDMRGASQEQQMQHPHIQPLGFSMLQLARPKTSKGGGIKAPLRPQDQAAGPAGNSLVAQAPGVKGEENLVHESQISHSNNGARPQGGILLDQLAPPKEIKSPLIAQPPAGRKDEPMIRYTRMVNSLQNKKQDPEAVENLQGEDNHSEAIVPGFKLPPASEEAKTLEGKLSVGSRQDPRLKSWQEIVNKVNAQRAEEESLPYLQSRHLDTGAKQGRTIENPAQKEVGLVQQAIWRTGKGGTDDEDQHMDAGKIMKEDHTYLQREVPRDVAEPVQDPNNQGEDEIEDAELERPNFTEKMGLAEQTSRTNWPANDGNMEKLQEDPRGEAGDAEDVEQLQESKGHAGDDKKEDYF